MTDPAYSEAIREAYALAPVNDDVVHTLEIRHPSFVNAYGLPDSAWVVLNGKDLVATLEPGAPVRGGEAVTFRGVYFELTFPPIENAPSPEMELAIDAVTREIFQNLDLAVKSRTKIVACYRVYLASNLTVPQRLPPDEFTLSNAEGDAYALRARARVPVDLRATFPRTLYTAPEFPGLLGR